MEVIRFTYNDAENIKKAFDIRQDVFVVEQSVDRKEEFDEYDDSSIHYLITEDNKALGTARWRISEAGVKLERFAVIEAYRGKGVGDLLLSNMIKEVPSAYKIYLHAQVSVIPFYKKHGFEKEGPMFSECNIDHYKMVLPEKKKGLSLNETIDFVGDFHNAFNLYLGDKPNAHVDDDLIQLRHRLMHEENEEYLNATQAGDLIEVADALGDMLYILCGTIITHGMQDKIGEVYREIQRSNMSKLDENGRPIYRKDGKVMKSNLYFKPDIKGILMK